MDLPPLSTERISTILSSAPSHSELYDILSQYEGEALLLSSKKGEKPLFLSLFYSTFFFSHLLTDQLYEARALTQRVPQSVSQNDPSLQNCSVVLRAVWQRNYEQVYKALRELPWSEQLKPIVSKYDAHFQEKTFKEVSRAYEAIRPAAAASYLGLDPDLAEQGDPAIIQKFTAREWKWDKETKLLHPKPIPVVPETTGDPSQGLDQIMALISKYGG